MTDITLVEGRLSFEFKNVDSAEKYDGWTHYRTAYQSACGGSKAVDFIVCKDDEVWLIEVKDYSQNERTKKIELVDEFALKIRDTMAGLVSASFIGSGKEAMCAHKALTQKNLQVALHLELPEKNHVLFKKGKTLSANLLLKLRQQLKFAGQNPRLINKDDFPAELGKVEVSS